MCSMLLRLVSALLTLLFVGSVHLYIMWETVRRPYVLVAMSAPQTVAHFCTWQRKWLCYWKRASAASLLWLCGILNQKGWWKCSPTFFRGPIATTRVFQGHRFPPLITSTYTHTHVWCRLSEKRLHGSYDSEAARVIKHLKVDVWCHWLYLEAREHGAHAHTHTHTHQLTGPGQCGAADWLMSVSIRKSSSDVCVFLSVKSVCVSCWCMVGVCETCSRCVCLFVTAVWCSEHDCLVSWGQCRCA